MGVEGDARALITEGFVPPEPLHKDTTEPWEMEKQQKDSGRGNNPGVSSGQFPHPKTPAPHGVYQARKQAEGAARWIKFPLLYKSFPRES